MAAPYGLDRKTTPPICAIAGVRVTSERACLARSRHSCPASNRSKVAGSAACGGGRNNRRRHPSHPSAGRACLPQPPAPVNVASRDSPSSRAPRSRSSPLPANVLNSAGRMLGTPSRTCPGARSDLAARSSVSAPSARRSIVTPQPKLIVLVLQLAVPVAAEVNDERGSVCLYRRYAAAFMSVSGWRVPADGLVRQRRPGAR